MTIVDALVNRNSHSNLVAPGPSAQDLENILAAGLRAPDHGHLRPWQFILVSGERRAALGELFAESQRLRGLETDAAINKALNAPLRAPLIIVGMLKPKPHPKIPRTEQVAAVACALYGMSVAADSLGYGGIWRTGPYAVDPHVISGLGGEPGDEVIGFLYVGTRQGPAKLLPNPVIHDYVSHF